MVYVHVYKCTFYLILALFFFSPWVKTASHSRHSEDTLQEQEEEEEEEEGEGVKY